MYSSSIIILNLITLIFVGLSLGQGDPFKINKLSLIWNKAQLSLGPTKLKNLKIDLIKHEADELSLKKIKAHNQDKDGLMEVSVRKKLLSIMSKYSLERFFDDVSVGKTADDSKAAKLPIDLPTFRDSKLDKLWKKAEKAGFDQEQLMVLHEEFQHQQDKLDDHYETLNMMKAEIERNALNNRNENSIVDTPIDGGKKIKSKNKREKESEKKARLDENIHQGLKDKYNDIKKSLSELSKKIASGTLDESPFKEKRVSELWLTALQSNFSDYELASLKEELKHYETRVDKLRHFQNQLERYEMGAKASKSYAEDDKEIAHVKKKIEDLAKKVEKSDKTIARKVSREEL